MTHAFDVQFDEPDQQLRILAMGRVLSHIVDRGGAVFRLRSPADVGAPSPRDRAAVSADLPDAVWF